MGIAAVPNYLGRDFKDMPPGHRFGAFFPVWDSGSWAMLSEEKTKALKTVLEYAPFKHQVEALLARQSQLAATFPQHMLTVQAVSSSPFMTGTGMEHPLENGFAFLQPYGLPYLPGSGIKGVLRRAAELMAAGEFNNTTHGWDQTIINSLFGLEPTKSEDESARGALSFWDVIIKAKDEKLGIDILTPHYGDYYAGNTTPHESGQPVPVSFLVVPPGAEFSFYIQCNPALIHDATLQGSWKALMQSVLDHAFDWLGFGAKTATGYGQLESKAHIEQRVEEEYKAELSAAGIAIGTLVWECAELKATNPGSGEITVHDPLSNEIVKAKEFSALSDSAKKRFKAGKKVFLRIEVSQQGNMFTIKKITDA